MLIIQLWMSLLILRERERERERERKESDKRHQMIKKLDGKNKGVNNLNVIF